MIGQFFPPSGEVITPFSPGGQSILPSIQQTMVTPIDTGVPGWALALGLLALMGGAGYFIYLNSKKKS
jgi:hypothetical protein